MFFNFKKDFKNKNKDEISKLLYMAVIESSFPDIPLIFKVLLPGEKENADDGKKKGGKADKFLGFKFRNQMKDLMTELTSCDCHFIRCIKPNEQKTFGLFVPALALLQIRYLGVLESIKVRRDSYPVRRVYKNFYEKYGELDTNKFSFPKLVEMNVNFKELVEG